MTQGGVGPAGVGGPAGGRGSSGECPGPLGRRRAWWCEGGWVGAGPPKERGGGTAGVAPHSRCASHFQKKYSTLDISSPLMPGTSRRGGQTENYFSLSFCIIRQASSYYLSTAWVNASSATYSLSISFSPIKASLLYRTHFPLSCNPREKKKHQQLTPDLSLTWLLQGP